MTEVSVFQILRAGTCSSCMFFVSCFSSAAFSASSPTSYDVCAGHSSKTLQIKSECKRVKVSDKRCHISTPSLLKYIVMLNCLVAVAVEESILLADKGPTQTARPAKRTWHALRAAGSQTIVPLLSHAHKHTNTHMHAPSHTHTHAGSHNLHHHSLE